MARRALIGLFLLLALSTTLDAGHRVADAVASGAFRPWLAAAYLMLKVAVAVAFAVCVIRRGKPRRRIRSLTAFIACAVAMAAVVSLERPAASTATAVVIGGELLALVAAGWMLASTLALGRCFGVLPEARGLVTHGPYRVVRHPLYLGEFGACLGLVIASPSPRNLFAAVGFAAAQAARMRMEERELTLQFPDYGAYARRTPRLIPRLRRGEEVELRLSGSGAARIRRALRRPRPLRHLAPEDGQALVEYAAILAFVSITAFAALSTIGGILNVDLTAIAGSI